MRVRDFIIGFLLMGVGIAMGKNVALVVASQGFQPTEYSDTKTELEKAGVKVTVFSDAVPAVSSGKKFTLNDAKTLDQLKVADFDAIALVGGPGALDQLDNDEVYALIQSFDAANKIVAAICISPRILAKSGVLEGHTATGWDDDGWLDTVLDDAGVTRSEESVAVDDRFITADGPDSAAGFGRAIAKKLQEHT